MNERQRTTLQNRSLHLALRQTADKMNAEGITSSMLYEAFKDMDVTEHSLKQAFQKVCLALYDTQETSALTSKQMTEAYDIWSKHIAQTFGFSIDWPSDEPPLLQEHEVT